MGQAFSEFWAPRRARRDRDMSSGIGMGNSFGLGGSESLRDSRMGFARVMALRREAV